VVVIATAIVAVVPAAAMFLVLPAAFARVLTLAW
jgi:hypothetical protein